MKYTSGARFRRALEDRLRRQSLQAGVPLVRLRKMVAFDRFLARLLQSSPAEWVLKGGLALQLRLEEGARTTKDIEVLDLANQEDIHRTFLIAGEHALQKIHRQERAFGVDDCEGVTGSGFLIIRL